jgi:hypothetical protein
MCAAGGGHQGIDSRSVRNLDLRSGSAYRVKGILHEYLGPADLPDDQGPAHVFLRCEWRPNTPGQFPFTLVPDKAVEASVTKARISGRALLARRHSESLRTRG